MKIDRLKGFADGRTLQRTATHCNALQRTATHIKARALQMATHCNTLQHTATDCNAHRNKGFSDGM